MRLLIFLTLFVSLKVAKASYIVAPIYEYRGPWAPIGNDGSVVDTPEVAQARAVHLALHAETIARLKQVQKEIESNGMTKMKMMPMTSMTSMKQMMTTTAPPMTTAMASAESQRSSAPLAPDGRVMETPEVAKARAAHLVAHAKAAAKATPPEIEDYEELNQPVKTGKKLIYLAPLSVPVRVSYERVVIPSSYRGPSAPLGPDGRVIDTPEVLKAREAHMKAHARAMALVAMNGGD